MFKVVNVSSVQPQLQSNIGTNKNWAPFASQTDTKEYLVKEAEYDTMEMRMG